jgi:hypothetical protein
MSDKFDSFFVDSVAEMLDRYPDVKYNLDLKNKVIMIDTQEDPELDNYLALKIYELAKYWGADEAWAL